MATSKIKDALFRAVGQLEVLTQELHEREKREAELTMAVAELQQPMRSLSRCLYEFMGDLEVESIAPDPNIDESLPHMRPAQVIVRARLLLAMAVRRLEEHHLEADELKDAAELAVQSVTKNKPVLESSQFRRNVLLVHGIGITPQEACQIGTMDNPYQYEGTTLDWDDLNEVKSVDIDSDDVVDEEGDYGSDVMGKTRNRARRVRTKLTKKHAAALRLS